MAQIRNIQFLYLTPPFIISEQEIQAFGPSSQEDPRYQESLDSPRKEPQDLQGAPQNEGLPTEKVRRQGLKYPFHTVFGPKKVNKKALVRL